MAQAQLFQQILSDSWILLPQLRTIVFTLTVITCLALSCQIATGQESIPGHEPAWLENPELVASRTLTNTGEIISGSGEVFDSNDYQFMLILGVDWDTAFILDLGTYDVFSHQIESIILPDGSLKAPTDPGLSIDLFTFHDNGTITFTDQNADYLIAPASPIIGEITLETLYTRLPVYKRRANLYIPDPTQIAALKAISAPYDVIAFLGSWCSLCKHNLPGILKTITETANPNLTLHLIAMDEDLLNPEDWINQYGIGATPTVIIAENGIELGRIEEEPHPSSEVALVNILTGN